MKNFGWTDRPKIRYTYINLRDDASIQKLVNELMDRRVLSKKTALEYLGEDVDIETMRINDEAKEESKNKNIKALGPYINQEMQIEQQAEQAKQNLEVQKEQNKVTQNNQNTKKSPSDGFSDPNNGRPGGSKKTQEKRRSTKAIGA
jgi:hypothetical protein